MHSTFSSSIFCFLFSSTAALRCSSFCFCSFSFLCLSSNCFSYWSFAFLSFSRICVSLAAVNFQEKIKIKLNYSLILQRNLQVRDYQAKLSSLKAKTYSKISLQSWMTLHMTTEESLILSPG